MDRTSKVKVGSNTFRRPPTNHFPLGMAPNPLPQQPPQQRTWPPNQPAPRSNRASRNLPTVAGLPPPNFPQQMMQQGFPCPPPYPAQVVSMFAMNYSPYVNTSYYRSPDVFYQQQIACPPPPGYGPGRPLLQNNTLYRNDQPPLPPNFQMTRYPERNKDFDNLQWKILLGLAERNITYLNFLNNLMNGSYARGFQPPICPPNMANGNEAKPPERAPFYLQKAQGQPLTPNLSNEIGPGFSRPPPQRREGTEQALDLTQSKNVPFSFNNLKLEIDAIDKTLDKSRKLPARPFYNSAGPDFGLLRKQTSHYRQKKDGVSVYSHNCVKRWTQWRSPTGNPSNPVSQKVSSFYSRQNVTVLRKKAMFMLQLEAETQMATPSQRRSDWCIKPLPQKQTSNVAGILKNAKPICPPFRRAGVRRSQGYWGADFTGNVSWTN